jgi:hypothetical protein
MGLIMLSQWPSGARFDPLVAATVVIGVVTAALLVTMI